MGEPIKAEKIGKHFVAAVTPGFSATPFGKRAVPTLPVLDLSRAINAATKTYGNSAPLFLLTSLAPDATAQKMFIPHEALYTNPVEISFATAHGHTGTIISKNAPPVPGAINCGVLSGPEASCSAEIEALVGALAERMAKEFKEAPFKFLMDFNSAADAAVANVLKSQAKGIGDWIVGAYDWAVDKTSQGIEYVLDGGAARDIASAADYVSSGKIVTDLANGAVSAYEWGKEAVDTLMNLDYGELYEACKQWLLETLGTLTCDMRDELAGMLADKRSMAVQMGEMYGTAKVAVAEAAAAVAVDVLVTKGAASAATRVGGMIAKAGPRLGKLADKIGDLMRRARRKPDTGPDHKPHTPPVDKTPEADPTPPKKPDGDTVDGPPKPIACLKCPTSPRPVNTIFGCKILTGDEDLDFVIDSPLPLRWQRTYVSSNPRTSCLGQGWSLPFDLRLENESDYFVYVDSQGRRIAFSKIAVGAQAFSPHEQTTLKRTARNVFELVTAEGLRLVFGLAPSDHARVATLDAIEQRQTQQFEQALHAAGVVQQTPSTHDGRPPYASTLVLLGLIDPNANWLRMHYAADDLPHVIECSDGRHVGLEFDADRHAASPRLLRVTELLGAPDEHGRFAAARTLVEYRYDGLGDLVAVADDTNAVVRTFAWTNHILVEHSEPGGVVARYEWDVPAPHGRVVAMSESTGESLRFEYDQVARRNRVVDASGRTRTYCYDENRYYTGLIEPDGAETRFQRDGNGRLIAVVDPLGRATRYGHDARGRLTRIVRADGSSYSIRYEDGHDQPVAVTDPLGQTTEHCYDARGNLVQSRDPAGAITRYDIDVRGLPVRIHDARGGTAHLRYDRSGRLLEYRDCLGQATTYRYGDDGNVSEAVDALGNTTRYQYQRINRRHRVVSIALADGAIERFAYDPLGRLIAHVDAAGRATRYALTADGRPILRENALGHTLRYQYDAHGRLLALTNENGAVYRFAWDTADRLVSERGFDGRRIDYRYNAAGELVETADGVMNGAPWLAPGSAQILRIRYQRDLLGRLTDKFCMKPDAARPQVRHNRFVYNLNGQLVRARNTDARIELHYTADGLLARESTRTRGNLVTTIEHAYDGLGNRYRSVLPDGRVLEHRLYGSGHVDRISLDGKEVCSFERDALQRETVRRQGALQSFFERDAIGRLTRHVVQRTDTHLPLAGERIQRQFHYDRVGQLLQVDDARHGSTRYSYDETGRLVAASNRTGKEHFAFDPASNLLDISPDGLARSADVTPRRDWTDAEWQEYVRDNVAHPGFNPLLTPQQVTADPSLWGESRPNRLAVHQQHRYRYDDWGNCVEKRSGAHEVRQFRWNAEHQLERAVITRVEHDALVHEIWGYDYDPFGRRIAKFRLPEGVAANDSVVNERQSVGEPLSSTRRSCKRATARGACARRGNDATLFAWDGNRLLLERTGDNQTLYLYEPETFVPLALVRSSAAALKPDETSFLPVELRSLKERYPEQWAAIESRRQKLLRKLDVDEEQPVSPPAPEILYVHADHLGTPRELTDHDGHVVWSATYKAWGSVDTIEIPKRRVLIADGAALRESWEISARPVEQNLRFQGQYFDIETGLHYNRFRYYDPDVGRFVSQDPIGLTGSNNAYQYASNPITVIDPFGLSCVPGLIRYKPRDELAAKPGARETAINRAWALEKKLIEQTGFGTRNWSASELDAIKNTKNGDLTSVMSNLGYTGHHINSVEGNGALGTKWQGDARNIVFLENPSHPNSINGPGAYNEHYHSPQGHRGNTGNSSRGRLIDRQAMIDASKRGCI